MFEVMEDEAYRLLSGAVSNNQYVSAPITAEDITAAIDKLEQEAAKPFRDLLEKTGLVFVHGSGFGSAYGSGHFRGVFLPPIETLEKAFDRLDGFMAQTGQ